jgi:signal transduction histidine kinase/ActR/RegA family two-component response regulator
VRAILARFVRDISPKLWKDMSQDIRSTSKPTPPAMSASATSDSRERNPRSTEWMPRGLVRIAMITSLAYGIIAALYILLSDRAVEALVADAETALRLQTYKGWMFVGVTTLLLFFGLRGQFVRWERDVTERQRVEETLRTRVMELQAILAHQPMAIFCGDQRGVCTLWEGRTWPEVEYPPPNIVGRPLLELAGDDPAVRAAMGRALQGQKVAVERRVQARTFEIFQAPLDGAGPPRSVAGVVVDITERKKLEAQLLRAQRLESVGRLAGGVAHDLNNILSPILIGASLLRPKIADANALSLLELIEASAKRGAGIIRQLLTFSRGATGEIAPVALQPLVADMRNLIRETFPRNITVRVEAPTDPLMVRGDATQLHQVLMNLCVNARDAMPEGGTLTFSLAQVYVDDELARQNPGGVQPGRFAVVRVRDTGTGISSEHRELIFDPFFTTKELGQGTGLGLSTALGIVKSHGGFIQLDTAPGAGTQFSIFLPLADGNEAEVQPKVDLATQTGKGECILIVDDEVSVRRVLKQALELSTYRVIEAEDGSLGLARFRAHQADVRLIITDVMMPTMDAVGFVRAVREINATLPIISISGVDRTVKLDDLKALGVSEFLRKPFALDALLEAVQRLLESSSNRDAVG